MKPCLPKAKRTGCLLISLPAARSQSRSRSCRLLASCQMGHLRGKARREGAFRGRRFGDRSSSEWKNLRFSGLERLNSWWGDRCLFQEATRSQLLHQDRLDWVGFLNASQTLVETLEFERQEAMINPQAMQDSGVDVADVDRVFHNVVTEIVRFAMHHTALNAAARHPHRETTRMVVAPIIIFGKSALAIHGSAKFAAPDNQRFIQHAAAFEVFDKSHAGVVHIAALQGQIPGQIAVMVPFAMENFDATHSPLRKPPGKQRAVRECPWNRHLRTIQIERGL